MGRERDFGWTCHRRSVGNTPTRDSEAYWRRGHLPDHGTSGLYLHGPADAGGISAYDLMTDAAFREAVDLDPGYGQRLHLAQQMQDRYNVIKYLAQDPERVAYAKLAMGIAQTPPARRAEIQQWIAEARAMRERMIEASKREALRLATR